MNKIVRPISKDGRLGFDEFGQLMATWEERGGTSATWVRDLRDETCPICGKGWELTSESFRDFHGIQSMGKSFFTSNGERAHSSKPCHYRCYQGMLRVREADFWYYACCDRGINKGPGFDFDEVPNEYRGGWENPWYRIRFKHLPGVDIIVGTRKRVYEIQAINLDEASIKTLEETFESHDRTKGRTWSSGSDQKAPGFYLHAETDDEAKAILEKISNALLVQVQPI